MRKSDLKDIILEAYAEVLSEQSVPTTMDELLARFPSLYRSVSNLLTKDYRNFVTAIEWVSPKPSTFRVVLNNQQAFYLKWLGKGFQANIEGKKYYIENVAEFQQALDRVSELLKHSEPQVDSPDLGDDIAPAAASADFGDTASAPAPDAGAATTATEFEGEPTPPGEAAPEFGEPEA